MKLKFLIASLTSCNGCISALMSLDFFPQFIERTKIVYFPFVYDKLQVDDCDVALIEGCISESSQIEHLKKIRKNAKKVYALGTCAAFGGILSLSKTKLAEPISDFIEVDNIIPGCPPPSTLLGNCLMDLVENKTFKLPTRNLCFSCPFRSDLERNLDINIARLNPEKNELEDCDNNSKCFLNRGILCLGLITRDGCDHLCINQNLPCEGCLGPVSKNLASNAINFLSLVKISKDLESYKGIYYRFSKPVLKRGEFWKK
jgi:F420-non-reducing hydrogenase small subunit